MPVKFLVPRSITERVKSGSKPSQALLARGIAVEPQKPRKSTSDKDTVAVDTATYHGDPLSGDFQVLDGMAFDPPNGGTLWLVHTKKKGMWYQIIGHDSDSGSLRLRSALNTEFDSNTTLAKQGLYMAVTGPAGVFPLPVEIVSKVQADLE